MAVGPCDTCSRHTDTTGTKTDTTKILLDSVPVSIAIQSGDQMVEKIYNLSPLSLSVTVKNKDGKIIKGVPVSFTAAKNSGSVSPASQNTDNNGVAYTTWTLNPLPDTIQQVVAKVMYNNVDLSVTFHATVSQDSVYTFKGSIAMDSINVPAPFLPPYPDTTNGPDPFTIASDSLALSNGINYSFELDSIKFPNFQPGEHGENGSAIMTINHYVYPPVQVAYEVGGLIIIEVTTTKTYSSPEPFTVTMYWQFRGRGNSSALNGQAYLQETVSSPTKGTFTNARTGIFTTTGQLSR